MPIDPVNPLGWGPKDPITSAQMNGVDQRLVRAVDGVQGGSYSGPVNLTASTLTGTSSVNTTGGIQTKGFLQGGLVALGVTNTTGVGDGASIAVVGSSIVHLTTNVLGGATVTLQFIFVPAGALYVIALDHSSTVFGRLALVWGGTGIKHLFSGGGDIDAQPTPGAGVDMWNGVAMSTNEIWWTISRDLR